ncbi:hypothetical protein LS73_008855 [Helicobacter muridarum]|uniref:Uncharacterized protein n=1 Tax=Helicobacter muridarum TaxID=216 RepID=A0A099U089_9HELI|nr:hypothetical protein [Helicobacter muridarum]TLD98497.1 hypothetical protein LS73_008855 [Helicobacter muridarum]STQ85769.1 Uncharacterised protein [Helicobacter muridarum]
MTKLSISALGLCVLAIISLFTLYTNSLKKLEYEKQKNANLEASLKTQNEALTKLQLDTQAFNQKQEILESEVRKKYEDIIQSSNNTSSIANDVANSVKNGMSCKADNSTVRKSRIVENEIIALKQENAMLKREIGIAKELLKTSLTNE